jgi:1-acyl-sn-glycerol-3-phosphate acyltransferase
MLGVSIRRYFYYLVSSHLFRQDRISAWYLNRIGGYSVWREGADRESLRVSARILAQAERPLVVFPEGTWFRQNDRLGPMQEGFSLIARKAVRDSERPIIIHPVALKYWYLEDPLPAVNSVLEAREQKLWWPPHHELEILPRLEKIGEALLAIQEVRHLGKSQLGPLDDRIRNLGEAIVAGLEKWYLGRTHEGWLLERVRRLRQRIVPRLAEPDLDGQRQAAEALHTLLFCENLSAHSLEYLRKRPSLERIAETVLRLEESITDTAEPFLAPMGAVAAIGPAIDVRDYEGGPRKGRRGPDPLLHDTASGIQALLDRILAGGPPRQWHCPEPIEEQLPTAPDRRHSSGSAQHKAIGEVMPANAQSSR